MVELCKWKDKEAILRRAWDLKPEGVKYFPDFAKRTLEKRTLQKDTLIAARVQSQSPYFVMDKLVIKEKQSSFRGQAQSQAEGPKQKTSVSDAAVSFDTF